MNVSHIKDLQHDPKNRRKHNPRNIGMLVDALHQVGAARSIVIDENGEILAGNGVVEAAAEAGLTNVQVVDVDGQTVVAVRRTGLTAEQKRALAIYDNRVAELAEWDWDQLAKDKADGLALEPWFSEQEQAAGLKQAPKGGNTDPDEVPQERPTDIVAGDLFDLGAHRLLCGDSSSGADVDRLISDAKADLLLTDPPYGKLKIFSDGTVIGVANAAPRRQYAQSDYHGEGDFRLEPVLNAAAGRYGHAVIWGGQYFADVLPISTAWLVWDKRAGDRCYFSDCELAWSDLPTGARMFTFMWQGMIRAGEHVERQHPTQKPVQLMTWILADLAPTASVVLDLFLGSGTTLLACEQLNRRCVGLEMSPQYCQVIIDRWEAFTGQKAVKVGEAVRA